ncbi:hypothetical protein MYXE_13470 [Mycobacterium xenopi]|uniref:Uncharacterized protein n=1 Tax=Mycobacterium xenopi TaxID=1789 RepID=A0AAD1GYJ9_MYCXE|nr:hypothetical protein MYXE_13470 [Mycobacterium xenopi]
MHDGLLTAETQAWHGTAVANGGGVCKQKLGVFNDFRGGIRHHAP